METYSASGKVPASAASPFRREVPQRYLLEYLYVLMFSLHLTVVSVLRGAWTQHRSLPGILFIH